MSRRQAPHEEPEQGEDDTGCTVLHVHVDAFLVSVELLRHPGLRGRPVIVGGGRRGVVLSATAEARRHGVRAAMPMGRARRLCPAAVVLPPHREDHARVSRGVMAVLRSVTDQVEPLGLDEAFLDVGAARRRLGGPAAIGRLLRDRITDEQGLTCSVGVAATRSVAKLASAAAAPDGLLVVSRSRTVAFLHALPVSALWGVGERTEEALLRLGLHTVADVAHTPVGTLRRGLGWRLGAQLHELAWGRDPRPVRAVGTERSTGAEHTFARDVDDPRIVSREILRLAERVSARLRAGGLAARTVVLKLRFADFTTLTRSRTLPEATDVTRTVYAAAHELHEGLGLQRARVRLVGLRVEGLVEARAQPRQLVLGERPRSWREADEVVDRASARFGPGAVRPATLLEPPSPAPLPPVPPPPVSRVLPRPVTPSPATPPAGPPGRPRGAARGREPRRRRPRNPGTRRTLEEQGPSVCRRSRSSFPIVVGDLWL